VGTFLFGDAHTYDLSAVPTWTKPSNRFYPKNSFSGRLFYHSGRVAFVDFMFFYNKKKIETNLSRLYWVSFGLDFTELSLFWAIKTRGFLSPCFSEKATPPTL
jgi:hypothetical protein